MIARSRQGLQRIMKYCREPLENIENYDVAIASDEMYELHHRDEVRVLPSGMVAVRSRDDLKENGRYRNCPANELIFLSRTEHRTMHRSRENLSSETRKRISDARKDTKASLETRIKLSQRFIGEKSPNWLGDAATPSAKQARIRRAKEREERYAIGL